MPAMTPRTTDSMVMGESTADSSNTDRIGTHTPSPGPAQIRCSSKYLHESMIRRLWQAFPTDRAKEATARIQGVQLIDDVRNALQLPITTYMAACGYYHLLRLDHSAQHYQYTDMALTCLFVACKSEDTLKKSRDIVCANHNLKNPDHITTPDDKIFDAGSKTLINLERYAIESACFDFQVRNPMKILAKIVKAVVGSGPDATDFFVDGYKVGTDMYKTFAPLKHTTFTCAFTVALLTAMVTGKFKEVFTSLKPEDYYTNEEWVGEVLLDILDLYTDHHRSTLLGREIDLQVFIDTKIQVIQRIEEARIQRYQNSFCRDCEREGFSPAPAPQVGSDGLRFVFDANEVEYETSVYNTYHKDEWEEWEEEVEEVIPERELHPHPRPDLGPEPRAPPREPRGSRGGRGRGRGRGRGGHDSGWHPRSRHGRGRGGGGH